MARNDSEWLGMARNLTLCFFFFTRTEVGIYSDSARILTIPLGSAQTAWIRSDCVGEGKVLHAFMACCSESNCKKR